uniref:Uncharacterized protein n=1 Tax=Lepeophtheirus salmonis TaxID=72036 RepID=A0A0K2U339_LEPSM
MVSVESNSFISFQQRQVPFKGYSFFTPWMGYYLFVDKDT